MRIVFRILFMFYVYGKIKFEIYVKFNVRDKRCYSSKYYNL